MTYWDADALEWRELDPAVSRLEERDILPGYALVGRAWAADGSTAFSLEPMTNDMQPRWARLRRKYTVVFSARRY